MNKRLVAILSGVALLLVVGIVFLFNSLFSGKEDKGGEYKPLTQIVNAIPADAIAFVETEKLSDIFKMTDQGSLLKPFLGILPEKSLRWEAVTSLLYSSKNKVSPLLVLNIPEREDPSEFEMLLKEKCSGVIDKRYSSHIIHCSTVPAISFCIYGNVLIASPTIVLVESSLRHLEEGGSIVDNPCYSNVSGITAEQGILHINHSNIGKFFSGTVNSRYIGYSSFFKNFSKWSSFSLDKEKGKFQVRGRFFSESNAADYSSLVYSQREKKSDFTDIVPATSLWAMSMRLTSIESYLEHYRSYRESAGKKRNFSLSAQELEYLKSLKPSELVSFRMSNESGKATAIRCSNPPKMKSDSLYVFTKDTLMRRVFGEAFVNDSAGYCCLNEDWLVFSDRKTIDKLVREYSSGYLFNLTQWMEQTPSGDEMNRSAVFSLYVNSLAYSDTLSHFFKKPYDNRVKNFLTSENFAFSALHLSKSGARLGALLTHYSENLEMQPVPKAIPELEGPDGSFDEDVKVEVPKGPFKVINFTDGSDNYLEQLPNNFIRLLNSKRNPVWTIKFNTPICGTVCQIDYLKNNKLQMLFGSEDKVYLFDRIGRKVGKFPISLGKEILLGPQVYDFNSNKNYTLVVLHKDNTIAQYTIDGTKVVGWKDISINETIVALPELLQVGSQNYWIVRTSKRALIFNSKGEVAAKFEGKKSLKKDFVPQVISSKDVLVTTFDGKEWVLDLENKTFKKR